MTTQTAAIATAQPAPACPAVEVVFARGTLEPPGVGATGQSFIDALNTRLPTPATVRPVNYPASLDFQTAADGVADAAHQIESTVAACPDTNIVLGGYSQGAAVAAYTTFSAVPPGFILPPNITGPMPADVAPHVAAVALFGTPDSWFLNLVDRNAPSIAVDPLYASKTIQLCDPGDPVCFPGGLDRAAHSAYKSNGMADQAAQFVADRLQAPRGDAAN
ncbi:cutinase family protein [Mycobacterium sp. ITM-2016-00317]|nr:cutinase family protein [Mycobacterium sp. ITM-2016-00317]WNG90312.1 cutinase family protein [Mycobacterium sp. ITM-2016-00317]